jgi:uncharacterized membrane protein
MANGFHKIRPTAEMRCPNCNFNNSETNNFCISCGMSLSQPGAPENTALRVELYRLEAQIRGLRNQVGRMRDVLAAHGIDVPGPEPATGAPAAPAQAQGADAQAVTSVAGRVYGWTDDDERLFQERQAQGGGDEGSYRPPEAPPPGSGNGWDINWEPIIGGNWLARVGVLAIIIGVGFFLKLAFDNNWIGETARVVLGLVAGAAFLGAGEFWRKKYPSYAQALSGAGVGILYLAVFAAFALYDLIDIYTAVSAFLAVSIASAVLAMRHDAVWLAVIGITGAFFAPFLLNSLAESGSSPADGSTTDALGLLAYIVVVDIGVIVLSTFRNWGVFTALALGYSLVTFGLWHQEYFGLSDVLVNEYGRREALLIAQAGLTGIFLSFVAATTLFHLVWRRQPEPVGLTLMMVNATAYAGISYGLLWTEFRDWMGLFTVLLSLLYAGVGYLAFRRSGLAPLDLKKPAPDALLTLISLGIALIFLTVAIPVQIGGPWVPVAWTVEALVLMWISFHQRMPEVRYSSLAVFLMAAFWLALVETPDALDEEVTPFWNEYFPVYVIVIAGICAGAYLLRRNAGSLRKEESELFPLFVIAGALFLALGTPVQVDGPWLAFSWTVEALAVTLLALRLGIYEMRLTALGLFGLAAVRAVTSDSVVSGDGYMILWNSRLIAFGPLIAAIAVAAYLWNTSAPERKVKEARGISIALVAAANFLAIWYLSAEVIGAVQADAVIDVTGADEGNVISLGLTVLWGAYGGLTLATGFIGGWRTVRAGGLILLAIPVFKLFLFDSFQLEREFRVAAFLLLGAILLTGGYLYQRHSEKFKELFLPQNVRE